MSARSGSAFISSSVTGRARGRRARMSTQSQRSSSVVLSGWARALTSTRPTDGPFGLRMIEEAAVARGHLAHRSCGPGSCGRRSILACVALGALIVPGPGRGFGLEEPVAHHSSFSGSGEQGPERRVDVGPRRPRTACDKCRDRHVDARVCGDAGHGAGGLHALHRPGVLPAVAWRPRHGRSGSCGLVRGAGEREIAEAREPHERGRIGAPVRGARRCISAKPRVIRRGAGGGAIEPLPMVAPAAMAMTFLSAPPSSAAGWNNPWCDRA